jgi:hypothetical protein
MFHALLQSLIAEWLEAGSDASALLSPKWSP